jgi:hypothetical protein
VVRLIPGQLGSLSDVTQTVNLRVDPRTCAGGNTGPTGYCNQFGRRCGISVGEHDDDGALIFQSADPGDPMPFLTFAERGCHAHPEGARRQLAQPIPSTSRTRVCRPATEAK